MNLYHEDPYRKTATTRVRGGFREDANPCCLLADDLFFPQGGGQKGDTGRIVVGGETYVVLNTIKDKYADGLGSLMILDRDLPDRAAGQEAEAILDWERRYRQMRLHSVVHLHHLALAEALGRELGHPRMSDIRDGEASNRYENEPELTPELAERAARIFHDQIRRGAAIKCYADEEHPDLRFWECLGRVIPCGGTHLRDLREIGEVAIKAKFGAGKAGFTFTLAAS